MSEINVVLADYPGLGRVRLCECDSIHLSIGPVTLNLAPDAFAQAAILIRNAMDQLTEIIASRESGLDPQQTLTANRSRLTH